MPKRKLLWHHIGGWVGQEDSARLGFVGLSVFRFFFSYYYFDIWNLFLAKHSIVNEHHSQLFTFHRHPGNGWFNFPIQHSLILTKCIGYNSFRYFLFFFLSGNRIYQNKILIIYWRATETFSFSISLCVLVLVCARVRYIPFCRLHVPCNLIVNFNAFFQIMPP